MARNKHQTAGDEVADTLPSPQPPAPGFGLDDAEPRTLTPARGRQGDEGRPFCERHNVLMVTYTTRPDVTHYRCPVEGCDARAKRIRPTVKVPAAPQLCPQRTCKERAVALEVDRKFSTGAQLQMRCPDCGFAVKVPRAGFAEQLARQRQRQAAEDLAER